MLSENLNLKIPEQLSKVALVVIVVIFTAVFILTNILTNNVSLSSLSLVFWVAFLLKILIIDIYVSHKNKIYYYLKAVDIILIGILASSIKLSDLIGVIGLLMLLSSAVLRGGQGVKNISAILYVIFISDAALRYLQDLSKLTNIMELSNIIAVFALFIITSKLLYGYLDAKEKEVLQQTQTLTELTSSSEELFTNSTKMKLEVTNLQKKLDATSRNLAELSTIQEIGKVINGTLNIDELLNLVNDIIIGLLGVTYCTIFLKDFPEMGINILSSNIDNEVYKKELKEKIALKVFNLIESGRKVLSLSTDPYNYPYAIERGIQSTMFVPIKNKNKILGLILAEHTIEKGLDDNTKKFVETIANQIGLAIENAILYDEMGKLANTDALTKVYNRLYFQENFPAELEKAKDSYPVCAMMIDIDNFKRFNDNYGHDFGDQVLRNIAGIAKETLGKDGIVARFGGEEFVVLLRQKDIENGVKWADMLRKKIEDSITEYNGKNVKVTVSIGVSEYPGIASNVKDLIKSADEALYVAKSEGRNCVRKGK